MKVHSISLQLLTLYCLGFATSGTKCPLSVTKNPQRVVGHAGERVAYECTVCGGTLYWKINGTFPHHYLGDPYFCETSEGNPGTLSIVALPSLNNVTLQCFAYYRGLDAVYSDPVMLVVDTSPDAATVYWPAAVLSTSAAVLIIPIILIIMVLVTIIIIVQLRRKRRIDSKQTITEPSSSHDNKQAESVKCDRENPDA